MLCTACGMNRIPHEKKVAKNGKRWVIRTCSICKMKDIEEYKPVRLWSITQSSFIDPEWEPDETDE